MNKYRIEVPNYGKSKLGPDIVEAEDEAAAVNIFAKQKLKDCDGVIMTNPGVVDNILQPHSFQFLADGHVFFKGAVYIESV